MMGMQTENLLRCLVRYHGDQFLSNCQVMTSYMLFFSNVGTYESLKHLGLRSSVYLEKELAASIVCWLDMLSASNIINILLLQQITLLNFPGKSLLCMKNGCTWRISKLLTNWHVLYVSLKDFKGQRYSVNLEIEKRAEFSLDCLCWIKHITIDYFGAWTHCWFVRWRHRVGLCGLEDRKSVIPLLAKYDS